MRKSFSTERKKASLTRGYVEGRHGARLAAGRQKALKPFEQGSKALLLKVLRLYDGVLPCFTHAQSKEDRKKDLGDG